MAVIRDIENATRIPSHQQVIREVARRRGLKVVYMARPARGTVQVRLEHFGFADSGEDVEAFLAELDTLKEPDPRLK